MRREHVRPLPQAAIDVLEDLHAHTGSHPFVFPSQLSTGKPISENTLNGALRRMNIEKSEHTSHGFRASASSLLNESGLWNREIIEAELAHVGSDQVRRAYHRAAYWDERVRMADWWANMIARMAYLRKGSKREELTSQRLPESAVRFEQMRAPKRCARRERTRQPGGHFASRSTLQQNSRAGCSLRKLARAILFAA